MTDFDLSKVVKGLKDKYAFVKVASEEKDAQDYISTGNLALDLALEGGIAFGYAVEFSGLSGSGKTLLCQLMLADAQKKYDTVGIWFDREKAWFKKRAVELGIDIDKVIVFEPQDIPTVPDMEAAAKDVLDKIPPDVYKMICIDSISAFMKEGDKADMGKKAQALHNFFRTMLSYMNEKTSLVFANQITFKIGILFGDKTTVTGGESPKYYSTYRIKLDDRKAIVDSAKGDEIVGNWIEAQIIKTRLGPNYRKIVFPFYYKEGIPYYGGYARLLADRGYLKPKNKKEFKSFKQSTLVYGDEQVDEFKIESFLKKHPELKFDKYPEYNTGEDNAKEDTKKGSN